MKTNKYKYNTGNYPTPMIMMDNRPNENVFNELKKSKFGNWTSNHNHYWTIGAYIIYNNNQIITYRFDDFYHLIWLLRSLNNEFIIELDEKLEQEIDENINDELILIK